MPPRPRKTAPAGCVELRLHGKFEGGAVSTKHVPLSLLKEFTEAAAAFVKGGENQALAEDPQIAVVEGSYVYRVLAVPMALLAAVAAAIAEPQSLWAKDPARAKALVALKQVTQRVAGLGVTLRDESASLEIKPTTRVERPERPEAWVEVTRYLRGTVVEMGGAVAGNLHLRPEGGGSLVKIEATHDQMRGKAWLYETVLVQVSARQHLVTREEADHKLLKLIGPLGKIPFEERLNRLTEAHKGRWAGITDAASYVRSLRDEGEGSAA